MSGAGTAYAVTDSMPFSSLHESKVSYDGSFCYQPDLGVYALISQREAESVLGAPGLKRPYASNAELKKRKGYKHHSATGQAKINDQILL